MNIQLGSKCRSMSGRARMRRGTASVDQALTLMMAVAMAALLATFQQGTLATFGSASLFGSTGHADVNSELQSVADSQINAGPDAISTNALISLSLLGIAAFCFLGRWWGVLKRTAKTKEFEEIPEPPNEKPVDATATLRDSILSKRASLLSEMSEEFGHVLDGDFEVFHLMSKRIKVVSPDLPAETVRQMMNKHKLHHLVVCEGSQLVGVVSDRDLRKREAKLAKHLMTANPITVGPSNPIVPTVSTMINKRISCLPVTVDGQLQGVLTRTDLLIAFQCMLQLMTKQQYDSTRKVAV